MSTAESTSSTDVNEEAIRAWDGPLYERFVRFREIVTAGLGEHGEEALRRFPPEPGQRVLDIGCGFGDTTQRIAGLVGPAGEAVGVDAAPRFIEDAVRESAEAGVANARFLVADVQETLSGEGRFDVAFSRFGTMFFANPVVALRNVRRALVPGGRLVMVVWRRRRWAPPARSDASRAIVPPIFTARSRRPYERGWPSSPSTESCEPPPRRGSSARSRRVSRSRGESRPRRRPGV